MSAQGPGGQPKTLIGAIVVIAVIVVAVGLWYWDKGEMADTEQAADEVVVEGTVVAEETAPAEAEPAAPTEANAAEADSERDPKASETPPAYGQVEGVTQGQEESTGYEFSPEHPYKEYPDGKFNFAVRRGYNMFHSVCYVCHGFEARGSSFAPSLVESMKALTYEDFVTVVTNGRENFRSGQTKVMPSFGENKSVMKYIDSLYAYLRARADGALGEGDPPWTGPKTE